MQASMMSLVRRWSRPRQVLGRLLCTHDIGPWEVMALDQVHRPWENQIDHGFLMWHVFHNEPMSIRCSAESWDLKHDRLARRLIKTVKSVLTKDAFYIGFSALTSQLKVFWADIFWTYTPSKCFLHIIYLIFSILMHLRLISTSGIIVIDKVKLECEVKGRTVRINQPNRSHMCKRAKRMGNFDDNPTRLSNGRSINLQAQMRSQTVLPCQLGTTMIDKLDVDF
jgi:hypothetical protein